MKKENRIVTSHILIMILSILLLISTGVVSYIAIINLFGVELENDDSSLETKVIVADVSIDRKSCNLIYSVDEKNGAIDGMILEFFDADCGKFDYVTVPANTKIVLKDETKDKIRNYGYKLDNHIFPRKFIETFGRENAFQFGQIIMADMLDLDISYYTVFSSNILAKYFVKDISRFYMKENKKLVEYEYDIYMLSESYKTKCDQVENDAETLIKQGYNDLESSFTMDNKLRYVSDYMKADIEKIYVWHILGDEKYNQFIIDKKLTSKLFTYIVGTDKQYTITQEKYNQSIDAVNEGK